MTSQIVMKIKLRFKLIQQRSSLGHGQRHRVIEENSTRTPNDMTIADGVDEIRECDDCGRRLGIHLRTRSTLPHFCRPMLPSTEYPEDETCRYGLSRRWSDRDGTILWILANPSTADGKIDDHTITKVCKFTEGLGLSSLIAMNLYAMRATHPGDLRDKRDLVADSDRYIDSAVEEADICFVGWGGCLANIRHYDVPFRQRLEDVVELASPLEQVFCLGPNRGWGPKPWHPGATCAQPSRNPGEQVRIPWKLEP